MSLPFLDNKYTKWYFSTIESAKNRNSQNIYVEKHHILPKSMGGSNRKDNIVRLSAREHFICHWLLTKMVTDKEKYKMWNAFSCMLYRENDSQKRYRINSRAFESIKKAGSLIKSKHFSGSNNPNFGKKGKLSPFFGVPKSESHKEALRIANLGKIRTAESIEKQKKSTTGVPKSLAHKTAVGLALRGKFVGIKSVNSDKKIYTWKNINTNQVLRLNRYDFSSLVGCKTHTAYSLIAGKQKKHKGWIVVPSTEA